MDCKTHGHVRVVSPVVDDYWFPEPCPFCGWYAEPNYRHCAQPKCQEEWKAREEKAANPITEEED